MKTIHSKTGKKPSVLKGVVLSSVISTLLVLLGAVVYAGFVSSGGISEGAYNGFSYVWLAVCSFLGGILGYLGARENGIIAAAGGAAIFYLVLICTNIVIFDGSFTSIGWGSFMVIIGAALAIAVNQLPRNGRSKSKIKYRYR